MCTSGQHSKEEEKKGREKEEGGGGMESRRVTYIYIPTCRCLFSPCRSPSIFFDALIGDASLVGENANGSSFARPVLFLFFH